MDSVLVLRGDPAEARTVTFSAVERPHGDALTFFLVEIDAAGLTASCSIESLDGDEGYDADATESEGVVERHQLARLSDFLRQLGQDEPWDGKRTWKSLTGELTVSARVDRRGHVLLDFEVAPRPWEPTWLARASLHYDLGDLVGLGNQLHNWFIASPSLPSTHLDTTYPQERPATARRGRLTPKTTQRSSGPQRQSWHPSLIGRTRKSEHVCKADPPEVGGSSLTDRVAAARG